MSTASFPEDLMAALRLHTEVIATTAARRMQTELPHYANLPLELLVTQNRHTMDLMIRMTADSDFSIARSYFEKLTETRTRAGISAADFLQAAEIMISTVNTQVAQIFAHDPPYRDKSLRLLYSGNVFIRNVIGRHNLQKIVEQVKGEATE